jgi:thiamine transport system ATP-binding protein
VGRPPPDPETALFLGYAHFLTGEAAATVLAAAGRERAPAVAIRRSALTVVAEGPLAGAVVSSRITPEQIRLEIDADGVGVVNAVSPLDRHPGPGERVEMVVDPTRLAVLGRPDAS